MQRRNAPRSVFSAQGPHSPIQIAPFQESSASETSPESQGNGLRIGRRSLLRALAGGSAAAIGAACSDPPEKLIPYLLPPDGVEFTPGNPLEYATTCMECRAHCGMIVRTREGRAIKAEGNPDHPLNRGRLCIRGQASLQTHYNPARLSSALQRREGNFFAAPWEEAEESVAKAIRQAEGRVAVLVGDATGTRARFLQEWTQAMGLSPALIMPRNGLAALRSAGEIAFGRTEIPHYRIEQARLLLNFGSEFLETWLNPVENAHGFRVQHAFRDATQERYGRFVHVGAHCSLTGANADEWVSTTPGTEVILALALARRVLERVGSRATARVGSATQLRRLRSFLEPYTLARAAEACAQPEKRLRALADEFAAADPGLAMAGGYTQASSSASMLQVAVHLLNLIAGNIGRTVLFGMEGEATEGSPHRALRELTERMQRGDVRVLIVEGANPIHALPFYRFGEALRNVPLVVSLSTAWDETTRAAHWCLPGRSTLERWGDAFPRAGVASLIQPVMTPLYPLPAAEDTLLSLARRMEAESLVQYASYRDYLRARWRTLQREWGNQEPFESFWRTALQRGGVFQTVTSAGTVRLNDAIFAQRPQAPVLESKGINDGLTLLPTASLRHGDGEGATNSWLQEIPDPLSQSVWDSWADLHPETARRLGIRHGELLRLRTPRGQLEVAANLHYGIHPTAIAVPVGLGRKESGRAADGVGVNVAELLPANEDSLSGEFCYLSTQVAVQGTGRSAHWVQTTHSPRQLGRGIIQTQTLQQAINNEAPPSASHGSGRPTDFYPVRAEQTPGYHDPYRWGMTVDVDRCTGCSACVAACYAENNIPVVGKERAGLGREMAWITIQRFLEGSGEETRTLMQPMLCQQCGNAGCEAVCPVFATYHNPDGLNAQIYNRCVGTRYCSNNCAYKVRRFNWFQYEWETPLHLQLNPDVSVRSKGVMEKCTFCVQRLQRSKQHAHAQGREVQDGEAVPACVQTCPTQALSFGNLADPQSNVSRQALARPPEQRSRVRQYEVFPELKQLPAITYLRKVVEKPLVPAAKGGGH